MSTPADPNRSHSFRRTRRDHANETAEDYVEAIADITAKHGQCRGVDLARYFDVTQVTVTKIIARLQSEGLVETAPYAPITLTAPGRRLAVASQKRHELVLNFLREIGVSEQTAEVDAEGIEHHVSEETLKCFQRWIEANRFPPRES